MGATRSAPSRLGSSLAEQWTEKSSVSPHADSLPRTVANKRDCEKAKTTVVRSPCRQQPPARARDSMEDRSRPGAVPHQTAVLCHRRGGGTAESSVDQAVRPNEGPGGAGLLTCNRLPPAEETYAQGGLVDRAHRGFTGIRVLRGIHSMPAMRIV
jgi:hypothetical protein